MAIGENVQMNRVFLSIDIDYWNWVNEDLCYKQLCRIFDRLKHLHRDKKTAVMNHQQMLSLVNESRARTLINVDFHSDLAEKDCEEFSCGTWVSYVKWRKENNASYHWIRPIVDTFEGDCGQKYMFDFDNNLMPGITDWNKIITKYINPRKLKTKYITKNVSNVSFCLSPTYCNEGLEPIFREIVNKYNLKYKKGRRREDDYVISRKVPA